MFSPFKDDFVRMEELIMQHIQLNCTSGRIMNIRFLAQMLTGRHAYIMHNHKHHVNETEVRQETFAMCSETEKIEGNGTNTSPSAKAFALNKTTFLAKCICQFAKRFMS
uniref:Uncharacterized protein n=1 Tax=Glossina pallidipes TaxID=7398 RepID=A0A1A9ZK28_GLOPL